MKAGSGSTGGGDAKENDPDMEPVRSFDIPGRFIRSSTDWEPSDVIVDCMNHERFGCKGDLQDHVRAR